MARGGDHETFVYSSALVELRITIGEIPIWLISNLSKAKLDYNLPNSKELDLFILFF